MIWIYKSQLMQKAIYKEKWVIHVNSSVKTSFWDTSFSCKIRCIYLILNFNGIVDTETVCYNKVYLLHMIQGVIQHNLSPRRIMQLNGGFLDFIIEWWMGLLLYPPHQHTIINQVPMILDAMNEFFSWQSTPPRYFRTLSTLYNECTGWSWAFDGSWIFLGQWNLSFAFLCWRTE